MRHVSVCSFIFAGTFSMVCSTSALAAERYVNCTTGNDSTGNGTSGSPWKTIAKAAASAGSGDRVHILGGPCPATNVAFGANLTGPGPDCRSNEAQCTVFRGEPLSAPIVVVPASDQVSDGFLITGGVQHLKIQNFSFQLSGQRRYDEPLKTGVGQPSDIHLKDVSVQGAHDSGIKIINAHDVLIEGGTVQGTTGDGYQIRGSATANTYHVVFRGTQAVQNGKDGYVVPSTDPEVYGLTFDRTRATSNGGAGVDTEDGYDIRGKVHPTPNPTPIARFLDAEATSNTQAGFKVSHSAQFENVYAANNADAGMVLGEYLTTSQRPFYTVLNSTLRDNAKQLYVTGTGIGLQVHNTILFSSGGTISLEYTKKYESTSPFLGGEIVWKRNLLFRGTDGPRVRYYDRTGDPLTGKHDCRQGEVDLCDATGDCNYDLVVAIDDLIVMTAVANGYQPLSDCYQGDRNGDRTITVDEITEAVNISLTADAHDHTVSTAPSFLANRHLQSGTSGWNAALPPGSASVPVCRAGSCDADSHARPADGGYELGAYEGTGSQGISGTCQNVGPGQCIGGSAMLAEPAAGSVTAVSSPRCAGDAVEIPISISGTDGNLGGFQVDVSYPSEAGVGAEDTWVCKPAIPGYRGQLYTTPVSDPPAPPGMERVRFLLVDLRGGTFGNGEIIQCSFNVSADAKPGRYRMHFDRLIVAGPDGRKVNVTAEDVSLEIMACEQ